MARHEVTPFNYNGNNLSTITDPQGEIWFVAKEVAEILDYKDATELTKRLDDYDKQNLLVAGFGNRGVICINESGLYQATLESTKPEAKPFKKWVTSEVLPAIRKTGKYEAKEQHAKRAAPRLSEATRAHLMVVSMMQKIGVRKEMAMAVALDAIHQDTGMTTEPYRLALPSVDEPANLNQTQLGQLLGLSSREVGSLLREHGLMELDESKNRVLTAAGLEHGEMKPYKNNGHTGYEPRWKKSVLSVIAINQGA